MQLNYLPKLRKILIVSLFMMLIMPQSTNACSTGASIVFYLQDSVFKFYRAGGGNASASVKWDFGDGQKALGLPYGQPLYHKYAQEGKYMVAMIVWDSIIWCRDTIRHEVCYYKYGSTPTFTRSGDTLKASAPLKPKAGYKWDFGDGTYGWGRFANHIYAKQGYYVPTLVLVKDSATGCEAYAPVSKEVLDFTRCGFTSEFQNSPSTGRVNPYAYPFGWQNNDMKKAGKETWRWGDGSSNVNNILFRSSQAHYFPDGGTFTVCHILEDSTGNCKDSTCVTVTLDSCDAMPKFRFINTGKSVYFINESNTNNVEWDIEGFGKSMYANPTVVFNTYGTYKVCLGAFGKDYCRREKCSNITVTNCTKLGYVSAVWDFQDCALLTTYNYDTAFDHYLWDFGDNHQSTDKAPQHSYTQKGIYSVKVIAFDTGQFKCRDSLVFQVFKDCDFCGIKDSMRLDYDSAKPYEATINNFTFNKRSSGVIHKHYWDFGDGTTSTLASPTHTYTIIGRIYLTYAATDTITNCSDTVLFSIFIDSSGNIKRRAFVLNIKYHESTNIDIDQVGALQFKLYPNPFTDRLVLSGRNTESIISVEVFNTLGQEMQSTFNIENEQCEILVQGNLVSGVYLVRVKTLSGVQWTRVLRE